MPIGTMVGTSQIYLSSCLLWLLMHSGPVWFPKHGITLNLICWYEWLLLEKCLDTGVNSVFRIFNARYVFINPVSERATCFSNVLFVTFSTIY